MSTKRKLDDVTGKDTAGTDGRGKRLRHIAAIAAVCDEARRLAGELVQARSEGNLVKNASLLFLELEQLNRKASMYTRDVKQVTTEAKQAMDRLHLSLQNHNYERLHLQKEIMKCEDIDTIYQDVELVFEEVFRAQAPPELTAAEDPHQIMLNRLKFEMEERKRMQQEEKDLIALRDSLKKEKLEKLQNLEVMEKELESVIQASLPSQKRFGLSTTTERRQADVASLLPPPLFVLYKHAVGYIQTYEKMLSVDIVGDMEQAKMWFEDNRNEVARLTQGRSFTPAAASLNGDESDMEIEIRHEGRVGSQDASKTFHDKHPLSVVLTVKHPDESDAAKMTFFYLPVLKIVVVAAEILQKMTNIPPAALLAGLFPNDDGTSSPNPANMFLDESFMFSPAMAGGYAYAWAQPICGLEFPSSPSQLTPSRAWYAEGDEGGLPLRPFLTKIVELVGQRIRVLKSLDSQINGLSSGSIGLPIPKGGKTNTNCKIRDWKLITEHPVRGCIYKATADCSGCRFTIQVVIPLKYPDVAPLFSVKSERPAGAVDTPDDVSSIRLPEHVQEIENQVNTGFAALPPLFPSIAEPAAHTLSYQVVKLLACLDAYVTVAEAPATERDDTRAKVGE
ncbi:THO complex subunit 5 [Borealophlyctis nickersoniae]|nr:THO complex subunit 5 [Borealophlyctis nickersoniae]